MDSHFVGRNLQFSQPSIKEMKDRSQTVATCTSYDRTLNDFFSTSFVRSLFPTCRVLTVSNCDFGKYKFKSETMDLFYTLNKNMKIVSTENKRFRIQP